MKKLLLLIAFALAGCGQPREQDPRNIHGIDPEFTPFVAEFETYYGRSIGDVAIGFGIVNRPTIGVCTRWTSGYRQITIDKAYWNSASTQERIGLMFHELGHCVLNRDHIDTRHYYSGSHIIGDVPDSIMYPYNFYSYYYEELKEYYYHELFNPSTVRHLASVHIDSDCVEDISE